MAQAVVKDIYIELSDAAEWNDSDVVYEFKVTLYEEDGVTPMENLDDVESIFTIKSAHSDDAPLVRVTYPTGISVNPVTGVAIVSLTKANLSVFDPEIPEKDYIYDWDLKDSNNHIHKLYKGTVTIGGDL